MEQGYDVLDSGLELFQSLRYFTALNLMAIQLGEAALIIVICIGLGGLPLVGWIVRFASGKNLSQQGTGNVSVAAAFQQVGVPVGILAALSEAAKGIAAVLMARFLLPDAPYWELLALMGLVIGRYRYGGGAGSTNVFWGLLIHAPMVTASTAVLGGLGFGLMRRPQFWQYAVLVLFCGGMARRYPDQPGRVGGAIALSLLLAWIYRQMPDDLTQGNRVLTLEQPLDAEQVGQKAATLAELRQAGYPVAEGWVIPKGADWQPVLDVLNPSPECPLIVRSSAVGEDQLGASAAGQYETVANITTPDQLREAIDQCFASYDAPSAVRYRADRGLEGSTMAALIQRQVTGRFSGVAFSRDPIAQQPQAVLVEGLPGGADRVVSGEATPERYRVQANPDDLQSRDKPGTLPEAVDLTVEGEGDIPQQVVKQVAYLTRQVERYYHGIPQDIEWTDDGDRLWLLQSRPITTLLPIWTRKIASEVLPGVIHPLTWSINQPITCGVWGDIFTAMLGDRADGMDFSQTATLHYAHTYFNATLIGSIFEWLGLPPDSLEFLTLGESFSRPSWLTLVRNVPGLGRLLWREWQLEPHFYRDHQTFFTPELNRLSQKSLENVSPSELQDHIEALMTVLTKATYYNILAPLSEALRQTLLPVTEDELDYSQTPEIAALRSLQVLAQSTRQDFEEAGRLSALEEAIKTKGRKRLLNILGSRSEGETVLAHLHHIVDEYGYLSESATDIAVPTWRENPDPAYNLFAQFLQHPPNPSRSLDHQGWVARQVQRRIHLKGNVAKVYNQTLAELRRSFLALAEHWHHAECLAQPQDIFLLTWAEVKQGIRQECQPGETLEKQPENPPELANWVDRRQHIDQRHAELNAYQELFDVPHIVYGNQAPPIASLTAEPLDSERHLQGIGASAGQVEGYIQIIRDWKNLPEIDRGTILTVPYTDAGWAPLLAQADGLISEVGGRLSHGAIVAREYGIPAVMNLTHATQRLKDGQRVRLHGQSGRVELLEDES